MPTELVKRVNLDLLCPEFLERLLNLLAWCREQGADFYVISGFRTYTEQAKLYFQGRTSAGSIVTNAKPGESWHNFGLAADLCRDKDKLRMGLQPDWDAPAYELLREGSAKFNLEWAGTWKKFRELPHVQMPGLDLKAVRAAFEASANIKDAWAIV